MVFVRDILDRKGRDVVIISPDDTIQEAANRMNAASIGGLVVVDVRGQVVGIFTERDVLRRVVGAGRSCERTRVREVMSEQVACCKPDTALEECQSVMTQKHLRHLPVIENGKLAGIITSGDILAKEREVQQTTIEYMHEYLHGRS